MEKSKIYSFAENIIGIHCKIDPNHYNKVLLIRLVSLHLQEMYNNELKSADAEYEDSDWEYVFNECATKIQRELLCLREEHLPKKIRVNKDLLDTITDWGSTYVDYEPKHKRPRCTTSPLPAMDE